MVHWRSFGRDFKTQLLEVLNSSRYGPAPVSNKPGRVFLLVGKDYNLSSCM